MPATAGRDPDDTPEEGAEADAASRSGRARIFGDYRILREVGRGGMGVVYEAWQISMGRRVALKVLSHGLGDPCRRRRFEREARSAGRLHHTNIVPVFGFGEHQGTPYYVMQYIRGVGLDAVLNDGAAATGRLAPTEAATASSAVAARGSATRDELEVSEPMSAGFGVDPREIVDGPDPSACPWGWTEPDGLERSPPRIAAEGLDPESTDPPFPRSPAGPADGPERWKWTARLGVQAAGGLDHAHSQGVLHRDVKPSNLLLDEHGILWLTDFGLAKLDDDHDLTRSGVVVGTLRYMPPEALDGVHGRAGDVYGLGLTLYELLARRPAFDGVDRARLLWQVSQTTPPPLRKLDRRIPLDLATVVHKAIERRPADRYATAAELAADLARFLEDRPILARRASAAERYWRWARRNPSVAVLGAILTAVLVLATVASLAAARRFREQADDQRLLAEAARRAGAEEAEARRGAQRALRELQAARDEEDRTLYDTRASLAGAAWAADDYGQYRALLELMRPTLGKDDARGWEWRYLTGLDSEASRSVGGPDDSFAAVATRPDGSEFATADFHGVIRIWRTDDGGPRRTIRAANSSGRLYDLRAGVQALAYSPDGRLLAGPGGDGAVAVYDAETGDRLRLLGDPSLAVLALAFSPDGSRLAAGLAGHTFRIWDVDADAAPPSPTAARSPRSTSAPTARPSPPPASTAPSGSGPSTPFRNSCAPGPPTRERPTPRRSAPTAPGSPPPGSTAPSGSGKRPPENSSRRSRPTRAAPIASPGRPTAPGWPRRGTTTRYGSGTRPTADCSTGSSAIPRGSTRSRPIATAASWSPPPPRGSPRSGTPEVRRGPGPSSPPRRPPTAARSPAWRSPATAASSPPAAAIATSPCGTPRPGPCSTGSRRRSPASARWPSAPTAASWSPPAAIPRPPPAARPSSGGSPTNDRSRPIANTARSSTPWSSSTTAASPPAAATTESTSGTPPPPPRS